MTDLAAEFTNLAPDAQTAYATAAMHVYKHVMDAIAAGYQSGGLDAVYVAVRQHFYELKAMLEIEDMI